MSEDGQCLEVIVWVSDHGDDDVDEGEDERRKERVEDVEERSREEADDDDEPGRATSHGARATSPPLIAVLAAAAGAGASSSSSSHGCPPPPGRRLRLVVGPPLSAKPRVLTVASSATDFLWECGVGEDGGSFKGEGTRLVSVDKGGTITLHELQRGDNGGDWVMARPRTCQATQLMTHLGLNDKEDPGEKLCLKMLSFVNGVVTVLLRHRLIVRILWLVDGCPADGCWADVQLQCTLLNETLALAEPMDVRLCQQKLMMLHADNQIYIYSSITGECVGAIDLSLIPPLPLSSLGGGIRSGFVRPSDDLSVIVVVDSCLRAICISPVDYFGRFPDHMFQGSWVEDPHISSQDNGEFDENLDEDDVERAMRCQLPFDPDRSWEAQLKRIRTNLKARGPPRQAVASQQNKVYNEVYQLGAGYGMSDSTREKNKGFNTAETSLCDEGIFEQTPGLCFVPLVEPEEPVGRVMIMSVCNTSALFAIEQKSAETNRLNMVLWEYGSGVVKSHKTEGANVPVEMGENEHPCLLLKETGLSMVLFGVSQDELLKRLMIHSGVGVVDAVCGRNNWGCCSIPIHALEAGLKNRQLDTVDFFLKSQENLFNVTEGQTTLTQLEGLRDLVPALKVLCLAIAENSAEASSQPFAEQLLHRMLSFLNTQLRRLHDTSPRLDLHQQECAELLMGFVIEVRQHMWHYPWEEEEVVESGGGANVSSGELDENVSCLPGIKHWDGLSTDEVIRDAVLTNRIPEAQAWLRMKGHAAWQLGMLKHMALHLAHGALQGGDLNTATKLIRNMGFDPSEQLHNICYYTLERNLRDFLVKKLIAADSLTQREIATTEFVHRVESMYASRTEDDNIGKGSARSSINIWGLGVAEGSRDLLKRVLTSGQGTTGEASIMLDWAYQWDDVTRQRILLDQHVGKDNAEDKDLIAYSPEVLWSFLTSRNDNRRLVTWVAALVGGEVREGIWPDLPFTMSYGCSLCSQHLRDRVLNEMARRGCFVPAEASDVELLVVRLSRMGGLMQSVHPLTPNKAMADRALEEVAHNGTDATYSRRSIGQSDVEIFHNGFIRYCVASELRHVLYAYLHHYRLEQSSTLSVLSEEALRAAHPWFDLLLHICEIQHLSLNDQQPADTRALYLASLANAQMVLPSSQAGVSSMLTEGRTLLAPATLLYSPGGLDTIFAQVDGQLLRLALSRFPKLRAALFPQHSTHGLPLPDVSLYHLLKALTPFDPSRLYGWQEANSLAIGEAVSELPHFSLSSLVSRHGPRETLGFMYFLSHGRPAYAYASFLAWRLERGSLSSRSLVRATEETYTLALAHFGSPAIPAACIAFLELLGIPTARVRVDVCAARLVSAHRCRILSLSEHAGPSCDSGSMLSSDAGSVSSTGFGSMSGFSSVPNAARDLEARELLHNGLVGRLVELVHSVEPAVAFVLGELENAIALRVEEAGMDRTSLKAGREWDLAVHFCRGHGVTLTEVYPRACAAAEQWLPFLAFVHHHAYPLTQVKTLINGFSPALRSHLLLAFSNLRGWSKEAEAPDMFGVLIDSLASPRPCAYLLNQAVSHCAPVLSLLAAGFQDTQPVRCLCAWIAASAVDPGARSAWAQAWDAAAGQPEDGPSQEMDVVWGPLALSRLVQDCLERRLTHVLISGFQLFLPKCPLLHLLHMFELCMEQKDYSGAKLKLQEFIRDLDDLKVLCTHGENKGVSVEWLETQASMLLVLLIKRSDTPYQLHHLFRLLSNSQRILKSTVHDFTVLSELLEILRGSEVCVAPSVLAEFSAEVLRADCVRITASLQDKGLFSQAKQVAALMSLPIGDVVVNELIHSIGTMKSKGQWQELKVRVYFWKRCHSTFENISMPPRMAADFFKMQASELTKFDAALVSNTPGTHISTGTATDLVYEELCLLTLAGHWLCSDTAVHTEELEAMEKQCWFHRIRLLLTTGRSLRPALDKQRNEDNLDADELGLSQTIAKFCFSDHPLLNEPLQLSLKRLPSMAESILRSHDEPVNLEKDPTILNVRETQALQKLVNQSLDASKISEAVRVCRYFGLNCFDVRLAVGCLELARGEESIQSLPKDITSILASDGDAPARRHRSLSVSSTSSFVLLPLEEDDEVAVAILTLAKACTCGVQFWWQVLNAYRLAKILGRDFASVLSGDGEALIHDVLSLDHPERVAHARVLAKTRSVPVETIATLLAGSIVQSFMPSDNPGKEGTRPVYSVEEGKQGFLQLLKLCTDPPLLGMKLMAAAAKLGGSNVSACVELLLLAHECFTMACHTEGIVQVLGVAKHLTHHYLVPAEEYSLMVRLLVEIGRYAEMTYILDILNQNHQFELLLRKKGTSDGRLKAALLKYIRQQHPGDSEKYNMVALCFSMNREIAENLEGAARTRLKLIAAQPWEVTPELKSTLENVLMFLRDAAQSYKKESCERQALGCVRLAKLVRLQLHVLATGQNVQLINLQGEELAHIASSLPKYYQVATVVESYGYKPNWAEVLYRQVVQHGNFSFLDDLKSRGQLQSSIIQDVVSIYKKVEEPPAAQRDNMKTLLRHCWNVSLYLTYRMAFQCDFRDLAGEMLAQPGTKYYLNDTLAS